MSEQDPELEAFNLLLTTLDGDVAVPPKLKKKESTVRKRLLEAGFEEEFIGEVAPRRRTTTTERRRFLRGVSGTARRK